MKNFYLMPHPPIMIKEVGKVKEVEIQETIDSCEEIGKEINSLDIDTIILISPHGLVFSDGIGVVVSDTLKVYIGNVSEEERKYIIDNN